MNFALAYFLEEETIAFYVFLIYPFNSSLRFTEDECEEMFRLANADDDGNFNYLEFVKTIKHGAKDDS